jgi:hypothetical protein
LEANGPTSPPSATSGEDGSGSALDSIQNHQDNFSMDISAGESNGNGDSPVKRIQSAVSSNFERIILLQVDFRCFKVLFEFIPF